MNTTIQAAPVLCPLPHRKGAQEAAPVLCVGHGKRLHDRLADVEWLWGMLDAVAQPGPSSDEDNVRGRAVAPAAPMRIEVLVARVDTAAVINRWALAVGVARRMNRVPRDVEESIARLRRHNPWMLQQPFAARYYDDIDKAHRQLRLAVGDASPAIRVGSCPAPVGDDGEGECGGALVKDTVGWGVHCVACGDRWDEASLRRLGSLLASDG